MQRGSDSATGKRQATLILNQVNYTFNGSVISCTAGSTLILTYTLVVGEYTYIYTDGVFVDMFIIIIYRLNLRSLVLREPHYCKQLIQNSSLCISEYTPITINFCLCSLILLAVNTTIKWVAVHENFTTPICKSPLAESRAPYWMIDGVALNDTTVNSRYGAVVTRLGSASDSRGRHQVQLTLHSMIKIQNGSNISCAVGSELRMVYIFYIIPGRYM